jgi:pimeloyl-ACP methyl ester carboxylesterase
MRHILVRTLVLAALAAILLPAAGVKLLFDPASPSTGPFPTDFLTAADPEQLTGLRINLPMPSCEAERSTCEELTQVNALDGFSIEPRIRLRFSGPIDPQTLRSGVFLVSTNLRHITGINAVIYDPATNTAYAEPDESLAQQTRYLLVVTDEVRDTRGDSVEADPAFTACAEGREGYCAKLAVALSAIPRRVRGASLFTTMSATAWLDTARVTLRQSPVSYERAKPKSVFDMAEISTIVYRTQNAFNPPAYAENRLTSMPGGAVGRIAFASYRSPAFFTPGKVTVMPPTGASVALPADSAELVFCAWLPKSPPPAKGYPVVIVGHGSSAWHIRNSSFIATALAERGIAVVAINAAGHGGGAESKVALTDKSGNTVEVPAGGRGMDINGDGRLDATEGFITGGARPTVLRDSYRQTALDTIQLVRVLRTGVDLDGDGTVDLEGENISYLGQSMGSLIGVIIHALEPDIQTAVLSDAGATQTDISRLGRTSIATMLLNAREPKLLNAGSSFEADFALRDQPPKLIRTPGALAIQEWAERVEWMSMPGDPLPFANRLAWKPSLFHIEFGDRSVMNPTASNLVRAAGAQTSTWMYRHDLARAAAPNLPADPHMIYYTPPSSAEARLIWEAGQKQIAEFLASGGARILDVNDMVLPFFKTSLFGVPQRLPEDLNQ